MIDIERDLKALGAERRKLGEQLRDEQRRLRGPATKKPAGQSRQRQRQDDARGE